MQEHQIFSFVFPNFSIAVKGYHLLSIANNHASVPWLITDRQMQRVHIMSSHPLEIISAYLALKITVGRIISAVAPLSHHHSELPASVRNDPEGQVTRSRLPGLENSSFRK